MERFWKTERPRLWLSRYLDDDSRREPDTAPQGLPDDVSSFYCYLPDRRTEAELAVCRKPDAPETSARVPKRLRAEERVSLHDETQKCDDGARPSTKKRLKQKGKVTVIGEIEGVSLRWEEWGTFGERGYYIRYIVTCPFHGETNDPCEKKRNIGARQTKKLG